MAKVIYYTARNSGCKPCEDIGKLIDAGKFQTPDGEIDLVDIMTDEGFERFSKEILSKQDGAVPSAYADGKPCKIMVDGDIVYFDCPSSDQPSGPEQTLAPSEIIVEHDASQPSPPLPPLESQILPDYTTGTFPQ